MREIGNLIIAVAVGRKVRGDPHTRHAGQRAVDLGTNSHRHITVFLVPRQATKRQDGDRDFLAPGTGRLRYRANAGYRGSKLNRGRATPGLARELPALGRQPQIRYERSHIRIAIGRLALQRPGDEGVKNRRQGRSQLAQRPRLAQVDRLHQLQ